MKFVARWQIPAMHGNKVFEGQPFSTWEQAELDAIDVRYEGVHSWVVPIVELGETPPSTPINETTASHWRSSGWWKDLPAHVVALAQARQPASCMPVDEFRAACMSVLGVDEMPTASGGALVEQLRQRL